MLSPTGRRLRGAVVTAGLAATLAGSVWGQDDHFPVGPFRMYARATRTTGPVSTPFLEATDADGRTFRIRSDRLGLRPAELEGQYPRFERDVALLGELAETYEARTGGDVDIVELSLKRRVRHLVDGRVESEDEEVVATWSQP